MNNKIPKIDDIYRHHNGNKYTVKMIANENSDREEYPVTIVYQGGNGKIWAKTLDNFLEKMTFVKNYWCCEGAKNSNGWHHTSGCSEEPDFVY